MNSRQWNKAVQILQVVEDRATCAKYYRKIAQHYANVGEYEASRLHNLGLLTCVIACVLPSNGNVYLSLIVSFHRL